MLRILFIASAFIFMIGCADDDSLFSPPEDVEDDVFDHINYYRLLNGYSALDFHEKLSNIARGHSEYMSEIKTLNHDNQSDRYEKVVTELEMSKFAELIARGDLNGRNLTDLWDDDEPSKTTILGDYSYIGVGVYNDGSELFATIIFTK